MNHGYRSIGSALRFAAKHQDCSPWFWGLKPLTSRGQHVEAWARPSCNERWLARHWLRRSHDSRMPGAALPTRPRPAKLPPKRVATFDLDMRRLSDSSIATLAAAAYCPVFLFETPGPVPDGPTVTAGGPVKTPGVTLPTGRRLSV